MPRKGRVTKRTITPDPKYNNQIVAKFVNCIMKRGKKSLAESILYDSLDIINKTTKKDSLEVFKQALDNVKPVLEVKSKRIGGATYQVPIEVSSDRRTSLAMRWIINYSKARKGKSMGEKLAQEIIDASKGQGASIKKKEDVHKMAEANKAFAHYR
ncbi:30S ribosomal protein S7 [bacterium]|nr:30S ribosomal protein S7 [bacterium]